MKKRPSAMSQGFLRCLECGAVLKTRTPCPCPICNCKVTRRKNPDLKLTTALIISGLCLYLPANIFPIMTVTELGATVRHTIMGGIIALMQKDMVPIALLVLIASILVPILKLLGISLLLLIVHFKWQVNARLFTIIYRVIAFVGRWSMLDIFIISILVGLVDLGGVAQVIAGPASTAFAAVVVITMVAAKSFDPRLLWDIQKQDD